LREQKEAVAHLTRFGLAKPTEDDGRPTPEYWKWYRWWDGYIKSLSEEEFSALEVALDKGVDVSKWRPTGSWQPTEPAQTES